MKIKKLNPNQIITLNDFPVHNLHILKIFFHIFKRGNGAILPPCPIISADKVVHSFNENLKKMYTKFKKRKPQANYFLIDGSHKTTAATLTHNKIKTVLFENDEDIKEARELTESGEFFSLSSGKTMKENYSIFNKHFKNNKDFQTVEEKTKLMVKKKKVPFYMIKEYKK